VQQFDATLSGEEFNTCWSSRYCRSCQRRAADRLIKINADESGGLSRKTLIPRIIPESSFPQLAASPMNSDTSGLPATGNAPRVGIQERSERGRSSGRLGAKGVRGNKAHQGLSKVCR